MRATRTITTLLGLAAAAAATIGGAAGAAASPVPPPAHAARDGTWVNVNTATRSVKQVIVTPNRVGSVNVDAFGSCTPTLCEWGSVPAITYGANVSATSGATFQTRQAFLLNGKEWSRTTLFGSVVRTRAGLRLNLRELTNFEDGSGRRNYTVTETFRLGAPARATRLGRSVSGYVPGYRPLLTPRAFGSWKPITPAGSLAKLVIGGSTAAPVVTGYGQCSPTPCSLGSVRGIAYGPSISSPVGGTVFANYAFGFKREQLVITYTRNPLTGAERLVVGEYSEFTDGSGRSNYAVTETLVRA
ncbi:MAG: hypothetical protein ACTHMS_14790 [Jatrophihabitans sp.]|uniref:hypothetical protein n=1 Tax=Jatrophihabitans sp. TaxID=1932789 RepID=UPI003F7F10A0